MREYPAFYTFLHFHNIVAHRIPYFLAYRAGCFFQQNLHGAGNRAGTKVDCDTKDRIGQYLSGVVGIAPSSYPPIYDLDSGYVWPSGRQHFS